MRFNTPWVGLKSGPMAPNSNFVPRAAATSSVTPQAASSKQHSTDVTEIKTPIQEEAKIQPHTNEVWS